MHRIDTPGNIGGLFVPPDPMTGQQAVLIDSPWLNDLQENIMAVLTAAGIAPVKGSYPQLLDAIRIVAGQQFADDTGAVNAMVVTLSPAPGALTAGMALNVLFAHTNTGATTLNTNGLGAVPVIFEGVALAADTIVGGEIGALTYDGASWELLSTAGAAAWVTNAFLAQMAADTVKGNLTGAAAAPQDVSLAALAAALEPYLGTTLPTLSADYSLASGNASAEALVVSAWTQRFLTTPHINTIGGVALSGNQITGLPAGTYQFWAVATVFGSSSGTDYKSRLYNVTGAAALGTSAQNSAAAASQGANVWSGTFTLGAISTVEIDSWVVPASGGGAALATGGPEVYVSILLNKIA